MTHKEKQKICHNSTYIHSLVDCLVESSDKNQSATIQYSAKQQEFTFTHINAIYVATSHCYDINC